MAEQLREQHRSTYPLDDGSPSGRRSGQAIGGITVKAPVLYSVKSFPQYRYPAHRPLMGGRVDGGRSCAYRPAKQTKQPE
jgi:hypothetical protein